jgi:hypothetical protein
MRRMVRLIRAGTWDCRSLAGRRTRCAVGGELEPAFACLEPAGQEWDAMHIPQMSAPGKKCPLDMIAHGLERILGLTPSYSELLVRLGKAPARISTRSKNSRVMRSFSKRSRFALKVD